jgi:HAD superfamily hydrolase (TIGR01509 family)
VHKFFSSPSAAVFDFDGLIADTASCWHAAYARVLARRGRRLDAAVTARLVGASVRGAAQILDVPATELRHELRAAFAASALDALPGVATLIERLRGDLGLAVATNGPRDIVASALRRLRLDAAFDDVVSAEALPREKPAPDVYLAACELLRVDPSRAVALEDSVLGAASARAAGLTVIQVANGAAEAADADLRLARIDDPALLAFLGLGPEA